MLGNAPINRKPTTRTATGPNEGGGPLARGEHRLDAGDPAQPPDSALRECVPELGDVIGQDAVAALRVFIVELMQHGDQFTLFGLADRDRLLEPLVVALLGESQHPTRDRHRHPHGGTDRGISFTSG